MQCLCTIWANIVAITLIVPNVYGVDDDVVNNADVTNDGNALSSKYKVGLVTDTKANGIKNGVKIAVLLRYLSNFWRSLEMLFINRKVKSSLKWIEKYALTTAAIGANPNVTGADSENFKITDAKFYVSVNTLSAENSTKLAKQLDKGFRRSVSGNKYNKIDNR